MAVQSRMGVRERTRMGDERARARMHGCASERQPACMQMKYRKGTVDRIESSGHAIVKDMFKKDSDLAPFTGMEVRAPVGEPGRIIGSFGKSGKVRVDFGYRHPVRGGDPVVMLLKKPVSCKM
jgi:40S ribosome biogenesis protein Tsr1 and BMS1 C-terminal